VLSTGDAWVDFLDAGGDARLKVMRPRECFSVCKYPIAYRANQAFPQRLVPFVLIAIQQIEQPALAERAPWMAFTRTRSRSELRRAPPGTASKAWSVEDVWCRRRDSNPHDFTHTPLKRACLPIPPLRHGSVRTKPRV
jgi:hypothetical protein